MECPNCGVAIGTASECSSCGASVAVELGKASEARDARIIRNLAIVIAAIILVTIAVVAYLVFFHTPSPGPGTVYLTDFEVRRPDPSSYTAEVSCVLHNDLSRDVDATVVYTFRDESVGVKVYFIRAGQTIQVRESFQAIGGGQVTAEVVDIRYR